MSRQVAYHFYYIQGAIYYPSSPLQLAWSALTDILPPVLIHRLQNTPQPYSSLQRTVAWLGSSCSWSAPEHNTAGSKILPGTAGAGIFHCFPRRFKADAVGEKSATDQSQPCSASLFACSGRCFSATPFQGSTRLFPQ